MNFGGNGAYGADVYFLKTGSFFFQLFSSPHIFSFSHQLVMFAIQPNDAKPKKTLLIKVAGGIAILKRSLILYI